MIGKTVQRVTMKMELTNGSMVSLGSNQKK